MDTESKVAKEYEALMGNAAPGVMDLVALYEGSDAASAQVDAYLAIVSDVTCYPSTTNVSSATPGALDARGIAKSDRGHFSSKVGFQAFDDV